MLNDDIFYKNCTSRSRTLSKLKKLICRLIIEYQISNGKQMYVNMHCLIQRHERLVPL